MTESHKLLIGFHFFMGNINSFSPSRNQNFGDKFFPLPNCLKSVLCEGEIEDPKEKLTSGCITLTF